jgi:hypothetical protein
MSKRNFFIALSLCLVLTVIIGALLFLPTGQNAFPKPSPSGSVPSTTANPNTSDLRVSFPAPPGPPSAVTTVRLNQSFVSVVAPQDPQSPQKLSLYLTVVVGQDLGRAQLVFVIKLEDGSLVTQDNPAANLNYSGSYLVDFNLPRSAHAGTLLAEAGANGTVLSSLSVGWPTAL